MLVAALFRHDRIPCDVLKLRLALMAGGVEQPDAIPCDYGDFVIIKKQNRSRVGKHRWDIRRNETLAIDCTDDEWIAFAHRDNFLRIVCRHTRKREQAFEFRER